MKRIFLILSVFISGILYSQNYSSICISKEEKELLNLINNYRIENGLSALEVSAALTYTADMHTYDLFFNKPHVKGKSLYSWSNKGKWKKLNYRRAKNPIKDIKDKPSEITRYNGQSLEAIFYSSGVFSPRLVFERWKQNSDINNMMLNRQEYATSVWKVIGVSHFEGYTSVWFGPLDDNTGKVVFCEGEPAVIASEDKTTTQEDEEDFKFSEVYNTEQETPTNETPATVEQTVTQPTEQHSNYNTHNEEWHVIIASASDMQSADHMLNVYRNKGLTNVQVVAKDGKYRISAGGFGTRAAADSYKQTIINKYGYKDAWILKK